MAPSSGHLLVPKVLNVFRYAISKAGQAVKARLPQGQPSTGSNGSNATSSAIAIPTRNVSRHPIHPLAALRQSRSLGYGQTRGFASSVRAVLAEAYPSLRAAGPSSRTATLARLPTAATFGSTLRPRLTGGALPRTAGGYVGMGGRRAFSHAVVGGQQAAVLANVSAAVRAFCLNGHRARFDGVDPRSGEKRFVAVGARADRVSRTVADAVSRSQDAKGTSLEFCVAPELTSMRQTLFYEDECDYDDSRIAYNKYGNASNNTLTAAVTPLAGDFARHLGVLAAVHRDLRRLSTLGDLPISEPRPGWIAIRFPGCDGAAVERLCDELGVCRGVVREDPAWHEDEGNKDVRMALLFPTAPSKTASEEMALRQLEDEEGHELGDAEYYFFDERRHSGTGLHGITVPESLRDDRPLYSDYGDEAAFTTEETLSPLESIHGSVWSSPVQPSLSAHAQSPSQREWQPNPWISEADARSSSGDDARSVAKGSSGSFQGVSSPDREMENIYRFIAQCDGRLGLPTSPTPSDQIAA